LSGGNRAEVIKKGMHSRPERKKTGVKGIETPVGKERGIRRKERPIA